MMNRILVRARRSAWALPLAALAAAVVFGINELAYRHSSEAMADLGERGVARIQIQTLLRRLIDAETGQRGYLLTGRKEYLAPYDESIKDIDEALRQLETYYAGDAQPAKIVADLRAGSGEKLSELATTMQLFDEGKQEAWRGLMLTNIGREKMEQVRALSETLLNLESGRIAKQRTDVVDTLRVSRIGVNAMAALSLLALVLYLRQTAAFDAVQRQLSQALQAERDRLEGEVVRRTDDLTRLARHLQSAREDERSRLARELHDELGALLTAAKLDAARLKRALGIPTPEAQARLKHLNDTLNHGIELKRRIIEDLRPSSLSNLGLEAALEIQAREFAQRAELPVATELQPVRLSDSAQITVYRLVQESLTNLAKHAGARQVHIALGEDGGRARIEVRDDGRGFDTGTTRGSAHGLMGMRYRVEAEGGEMRVQSTPGQGTVIEAWLPLLPAAPPAPEAAEPTPP